MIQALATGLSSTYNVVRSKSFQWFLVVLSILIIVILIYRKGRKDSGFQKPADLPNGGSGLPSGWDYKALVDRLWDNLDPVYWYWLIDLTQDERVGLMETLMSLSDDQLTAVYNDYNYRYGNKDGKKSLTKKISEEYFLSNKDAILSRLRKLGLT